MSGKTSSDSPIEVEKPGPGEEELLETFEEMDDNVAAEDDEESESELSESDLPEELRTTVLIDPQ